MHYINFKLRRQIERECRAQIFWSINSLFTPARARALARARACASVLDSGFWNVGGRPSNCNRHQRWEIENKLYITYVQRSPFTFAVTAHNAQTPNQPTNNKIIRLQIKFVGANERACCICASMLLNFIHFHTYLYSSVFPLRYFSVSIFNAFF